MAAPANSQAGTKVAPIRWIGCPCGCNSRHPWLDDPNCIRHQDPAERYRRRRKAAA